MRGKSKTILALITSILIVTGDSASHALVAAPNPPNNSPVPGPPPAPILPIIGTAATCQSIITQSTNQEVTSGALPCLISHPPPGGNVTVDTSYWRAFDMAIFSGRNKYFIRSVSFGVKWARVGQSVRIRLYTNNGGTFPEGTRTEIGSTVVGLSTVQSGTVVTTPLLAVVPARTEQLVMEVFSPASPSELWLGANTAPETGLSYWNGGCTGGMTQIPMNLHLVFNIYGGCVAEPGIFEPTGNFAFAQAAQTATLLQNGKVLLGGAYGELYDPGSGTWTETGGGVSSYTATLMPNGKVLAEGAPYFDGHVTHALPYVWQYDPATGLWPFTTNIPTARIDQAAALLPSGLVLVTGGVDVFPLTSAETYDPTRATWSPTGSLITARAHHSETLLLNGKILVFGGDTGYGNFVFTSSELYDPANGTWSSTGDLNFPRLGHMTSLLPDGKVLVAGGIDHYDHPPVATAELYDPATGTWTMTGSLTVPRYRATATLLPNGTVLVTGGSDGTNTLASAEVYDPESGNWSATDSMGTPRSSHTATLLPNGNVLIAGGYDGTNLLASAELYVGLSRAPTFLNTSTRMQVLTEENVLIAGFIVTGTDLKRVLIRGIGPSLNVGGGALSDPTLELHQGSLTIASNDNWKMRPNGTSQQADIEGTTIPPTNDAESAILAMLSPGAYTAILSGKDRGTGIGLVEIYDLGQGANSELANISTRAFVNTGDNVLIGGFIVGSGSPGGSTGIIVRALGPSIPVGDSLGDPTLELHDASGTLLDSNDNWKTRPDGSSQQAEIEATGIPPTNDVESALVRVLTPGNYTVIVQGKDGTTGVGLVETYWLH